MLFTNTYETTCALTGQKVQLCVSTDASTGCGCPVDCNGIECTCSAQERCGRYGKPGCAALDESELPLTPGL